MDKGLFLLAHFTFMLILLFFRNDSVGQGYRHLFLDKITSRRNERPEEGMKYLKARHKRSGMGSERYILHYLRKTPEHSLMKAAVIIFILKEKKYIVYYSLLDIERKGYKQRQD